MLIVDPLVAAAVAADNISMAHLVDLPGPLYFTDHESNIAYGGETYFANGKLLSLSSVMREGGIKTHSHTIKLSSVETDIIDHFVNTARGGQPCLIQRAILDGAGAIIASEPIILYKGTLDSWSLIENAKNSTLTLKFTNNWAANQATSGRRTTMSSQQEVDSTDVFFDKAHEEISNIEWGL